MPLILGCILISSSLFGQKTKAMAVSRTEAVSRNTSNKEPASIPKGSVFFSEQSKRTKARIGSVNPAPQMAWLKKTSLSENKAFIENKGQNEDMGGLEKKGLLFSYRDGITEYFFTHTGVIYRIAKPVQATERQWEKYALKNGIPANEEGEEENEQTRLIEKQEIVEMNWTGGNTHSEIISESPLSQYFNFLLSDKDGEIIGGVKGYQKLTYKNIYPNIDIEYRIHPEGGIKYTYILHPGADPALIQMTYSGAKIRFDDSNNLILSTSLGTITDHAPESFVTGLSQASIGSSFVKLNSATIGFQLETGIQKPGSTILIDPWTIGPPTAINESADDIAVDGANNVLVYSVDTVGGGVARITKYNSAGVQQWTLNVMSKFGYYYLYQGDVQADPAGNVYFSMGLGIRPKFYNTVKVDPSGTTRLWGSATAGASTSKLYESWNLSFNCDYTQLIQSGGGVYRGGLAPYHNNANWETVNTATGVESGLYRSDSLGEIISSFWAPNGLIYHLTADSNVNIASTPYTSGAHNRLSCFNPATGFTKVFVSHTDYSYRDFDKKAPFSTGMNSLTASCAYVYTSDGVKLDQWDALTGVHVNSIFVPGGSNTTTNNNNSAGGRVNSGLTVDNCGNVFVGSFQNVYEYDANLNLISTISGFPDYVFDITLGSNNTLYVCGGSSDAKSFVAAVSVGACIPPIALTVAVVQPACSGNTGSATANPTFCGAPYAYSWSTGATTQSVSGLAAGTYTVVVKGSLLCPTSAGDTVIITVSAAPGTLAAGITSSNVSCNAACNGSATVSPSGGTFPYTYAWTNGAGTAALASGLCPNTYVCSITDNNGCTTSQSATISQPAVLTTNPAQTNVSCFGTSTGAASVAASGGTPAYTYSWTGSPPVGQNTNSVSGLIAGTYTCTTTDANGCTSNKVISISQPASALNDVPSQTNVTCNGTTTGTASVVPSGGTVGYTYSWIGSPLSGQGTASVSGLSNGTYTCTLTDSKNCSLNQVFTISQPAVLAISPVSSTTTACASPTGTASVSVSGGNPGYTYSWNPAPGGGQGTANATGLAALTYTLTVTDAKGCVQTYSIAIGSANGPTATLGATTNLSCKASCNGSATVSANGGTGALTYAWTPSGGNAATASGLCAGNYTCTVTDQNGCTASQTAGISEPTVLSTTPTHTNVNCFGTATATASVAATGGTAAYTYSWTGSPPVGQNTNSISGLTVGTYTCTTTDSKGCTNNQVISITQPASALSDVPAQTNVSCSGTATGTASVTPSGGTASYTYNWIGSPLSGQGTSSVTGLSNGTYTCTITDANSCTLNQVFTVSQPGVLAVNPNASTATACTSPTGTASVTVTGGNPVYTYSWNPIPGGGQGTSSVTGLNAGTYTLYVTDAKACSQTYSVTILSANGPNAAVASTTNLSCNAVCSGTATVNGSGGTGSLTFSWAPSGGNTSTAGSLCAGSYTCTVIDQNGCKATQTVSISQPPALAFSPSSTVATCNTSNGTATANASGGTGSLTYSWTSANPIGSGQGTNQIAGLSAGTYTVHVTDASACSSTATVVVNNAGAPTVSAVQTNPVCNAACTGSITVTPAGGTGAGTYTYSWSNGVNTTNSSSGLCAGTYTCFVRDANNCLISQVSTISAPAALALNPTQTNISCKAACNGVATVATTGGTAGYTYSWSGNGSTTNQAIGLCPNTYTCSVTDANACSATQVFTITEPPLLVLQPTQTNVLCNGACNGSAGIVASGGTAVYSYSWSGSAITGPSLSNLCPGTYSCSVTDANGCTGTKSFVINQPAVLAVTGSTSNATCQKYNGSATVNASGGSGAYTYSWSPSGGTGPTAVNLDSGIYTCTIMDSLGCTRKQIDTVLNVGQLPHPLILASGTTTICSGKNVTLTASGGTSYSWSTGAVSPSIVVSSAGMYTVSVTNSCGTSSAKDSVFVKPLPLPAISGLNKLCLGDMSILTASGGTSYSWNTGALTDTIHVTAAGVYTVATTNSCGTASTTMTVQVNTVSALFSPNTHTGNPPLPILFTNNSSANATTWSWSYGDGSTGNTFSASHTYAAAGTYTVTLTVTEPNGCTSVYTDVIVVNDKPSVLLIPNIFTPNGDGSNDNYQIIYQGIKDFNMKIYDRWGVLMAELVSPAQVWDGYTSGGLQAVNGTYYYIIKALGDDGVKYDLTGFIMLIRQ
jgi:gliding motility-associated-like protein